MKGTIIKYKWAIVVIAITLIIFIINGAGNIKGEAMTVPKEQAVLVQKVLSAEKTQLLELTGTLEARDNIIITSKYGGKVNNVLVENGQNVHTNQNLILMEATQQQNALIQAQNALAKANANLNYIQKNYERMKNLYDAEVISQNDMDNAELSYQVAKADVNSAQAIYSNAQDAVKDTEVSSRIKGTVADCNIKSGQMVQAGTPLMTVQDLSHIYLVVNVNQDDISKIALGEKVNVSVDAFSAKTFNGTVEIINPVANTASRSFEVKMVVENTQSLLKPGMFAKVQIEFAPPKRAITVPQSAVSGKDGLYYVFVANDHKAEKRSVGLGDTMGQEVEVKSGLAESEKLIISNVNKLKDGDTIRISKTK
ncbi:efflux RND transporter periplasmic adaptor subunit [Aminipila terrae]|uniref:Efflux RND transporter periplasmic adaptor subunit n=1 Tax=Aminipila terrae TaxID=2697030 RepID=A0A6P1MEX8_9FIRM|nr:efflux RND transporter periplasmic adaptor subunit [Aminipila terrae]QHI72371.1 efflux RND transporter periplasmic adaptor subunit [Aminipila terrae]